MEAMCNKLLPLFGGVSMFKPIDINIKQCFNTVAIAAINLTQNAISWPRCIKGAQINPFQPIRIDLVKQGHATLDTLLYCVLFYLRKIFLKELLITRFFYRLTWWQVFQLFH